MFRLPDGYSFEPDERAARTLLFGVPGGYKGADISRQRDAKGNVYVGCCARNPAGQFGFRVFRQAAAGGAFVEVPLPDFAEGRGEIAVDHFDGQLWYAAWRDDGSSIEGPVPGCAPFPTGLPIGTPTPAPPPAPATTVDAQARAQLAELNRVVQALGAKNGTQDQRLTALEQRPAGGALGQAELDVIWSKAGDRIADELKKPYSPLSSYIWQKAVDAAYAEVHKKS